MQRIIRTNVPLPPPHPPLLVHTPQAVLWELTVLRAHYHPALLRLLPCICNPNDTHAPDPIEFLAAFDPAKVTFRPPIRRPPPHPLHALRSKRQGKRANARPVSVSSITSLILLLFIITHHHTSHHHTSHHPIIVAQPVCFMPCLPLISCRSIQRVPRHRRLLFSCCASSSALTSSIPRFRMLLNRRMLVW